MADLSTAHGLIQRYEDLKSGRHNFEDQWQEIADHIVGMRDFNTQRSPGEKRMDIIYDTTGLLAGNFLAGALHGMLTNPSSRWFFMDVDDDTAQDDSEAKAWLDIADKGMQTVQRRGEYGFLTAIAEAYKDQAFFGNSDIFIDDVKGFGPRYYSRPLSEIYIDEAVTGQVDSFYRSYKLTVRQALQEFGDRAMPDSLVRKFATDPDEKVEFLHVVHPSEETRGKVHTIMPWRSVHVCCHEGENIVKEGGYWTKPHQFARWSKDSRELYGRGAGGNALPDCKMLNAMSKTVIVAGQKQVDPALMVADDGVLTQIDTSPGSLNVVRDFLIDKQPIRRLLEDSGTPVITDKLIEQRQDMVERHFMTHLLSARSDPRMTATQVLELETQIAQLLVSTLGRLQVEMVEPMLDRTLDVMERGGFLPARPEALRDKEVRARFLSPVERVQRQGEAQALLGTWADAAQIAPMHPEVFDNFDADFTARAIAEARGIPPRGLVSVEERDETRDLRAEMEQQAAAKQALMEGAEMGAKLMPGIAKLQEANAA